MGHNHYRLPVHVPQREEQLVKLLLCLAVQVTRRLISIKHCRVVDKSPCDRHPLLLSPGQLGRLMIAADFASLADRPAIKAGIITFSTEVNSGSR